MVRRELSQGQALRDQARVIQDFPLLGCDTGAHRLHHDFEVYAIGV